MAEDWYTPQEPAAGGDDWMTPESSAPSLGESALDVAKQAGAGVVTGAEARMGAIPSLLGAAGRGVEWLTGQKGDPEAVAQREQLQKLIAQQRGGGIAQYLPEPQTEYGAAARRAPIDARRGGPGS